MAKAIFYLKIGYYKEYLIYKICYNKLSNIFKVKGKLEFIGEV